MPSIPGCGRRQDEPLGRDLRRAVGGSDTLDTIRHSGDPLSIVSQSVNSVTAAPTPSGPSIPPAVDRALAIWGEAEAERAVIVGDEGAIPRIGIPEIPEEPVLLRDGRSLGSVARAVTFLGHEWTDLT